MRLKANHIAILFIAAFLIASFFIINDYGAILDSQKNYHEGEVNLTYVLSGKIEQQDLWWQMHGAFSFMLADASRRLLSNRLNLLDPISARHVILPILSAFFMYPLFLFVRRHWGEWQGLIAIACFATYPAIFGHTFNNLKDVPLLIFFSISIIFFTEWWESGKIRYLYGYFIFWGFAISVKTYALLVPVILIPWMLVSSFFMGFKKEDRSQINMIFHLLIGLSVTSIIVLLLYAPGFLGIENKLSFLEFWHYRAKGVALGGRRHWNVIPFTQVFFKTPIPILIFSIVGIVSSIIEYRKATVNTLLLFWMFIPIIIPCLPSILLYHDGLRLFLVFAVPFSILAVLGLTRLAEILRKYFKISKTIFICLLGVMMIGLNFHGVITTHPYQITFFNRLAGGLKGAQEKGIKDALDYWLNCYKEAGRWLDDNAAKNSKVLVVYQSGTHPKFNTDLMKYSISREDISITRVPVLPTLHGKPFTLKNTYVVMVPKFYLSSARDLLNSSPEYEIVYQIKRQGGEICTIYYNS